MAYTPTNWQCGDTITAEKLNKLEQGLAECCGGGGGASMESVTYAELKTMRDGGNLTSGAQYRITDYVCTTTQSGSRVVSHPYDIIVVADDESTLNENARACLHSGDAYYSSASHSADLEAWELKYCIDNDTSRFAWADTTNGKGVVYWLKDERNNECPYDFKQIQFYREIGGGGTAITGYFYTFSVRDSSAAEVSSDDASVALTGTDGGMCSGNVIRTYFDYADRDNYSGVMLQYLNDIVFDNLYNAEGGFYCTSNTFGDRCNSNTFGNECNSNTFGNVCYSNTFGNECNYNTFGNECYSNTFGNVCYSNTFGDVCYSNTFGDSCNSNTFGDSCNSNTFGDVCYSNTFGNYCYSNTFGDECYSNTFGNRCNYNTFGNVCNYNTFGNECSYNTFGNECYSNTFGNGCNSNTFGNYCGSNTFGNECNYIDLFISSGNGANYNVLAYVQGTSSTHYAISGTQNNQFVTYVGKNSSGVIKTWVPADAVA